jgi:F-type H+-transporting ATPase subunit b
VPTHEVEATAFGLTAPAFIALAMIVVVAILIWKKVPGAIAGALDAKIETMKGQLAEAENLRKEAEALRDEYEAKAKSVEGERTALLARARKEAEEIVAKAESDAKALVERRGRMAEDKIASEQRAAVEQIRATASDAAARAAARLIAERHDADSDARLVSQAIGEIGRD